MAQSHRVTRPRGPFVVADALLKAYSASARVNQYLVQQLHPDVWRAPSPLPKGRTIAALVAHMHNCGLRYVEHTAPGVPVPAELDRFRVTQAQAGRALGAKRKAVVAIVGAALRGDGRIARFPYDAAGYLAYYMVHDAHHRGQDPPTGPAAGPPGQPADDGGHVAMEQAGQGMSRLERRQFVCTTAAALGGLVFRPWAAQGDWKTWRVNGPRVNQHLAELARFGANPQGGVSRVAFTQADIDGRAFAIALMRRAGLDARIDAVGNLFGTRAGTRGGALPVLFGSHIDSVPEGGNYDGDVGSLAAIEVAQTLAERGYRNRHPLQVAIWCDEESGLTGSRGFIGDLPADEVGRPGRDGVLLAEKIRRIGGDPERLAEARHAPGSVAAYVELHIEQGGILDEKRLQIGIVEGIVGIHHYDVTIRGFANHAGTTPMDRRQNALLAAAELSLAVDRIVRSVPGRQVGTVGRLIVKPGAPNVIPGQVDLTVELRDLSTERIESLWSRIHVEALDIARRYDTSLDYVLQHVNAPALSDPEIRAVIADAVQGLGLSSQVMPSGAGHDAQDLARIGPMGMIFVPSVKGISHSPLELTRPDDVTNGANVLLQTVLRLDQQ